MAKPTLDQLRNDVSACNNQLINDLFIIRNDLRAVINKSLDRLGTLEDNSNLTIPNKELHHKSICQLQHIQHIMFDIGLYGETEDLTCSFQE